MTLEYAGSQVDAQTLVLLARACRGQRLVSFDYRRADGTDSTRRVEPYRMVATGRRWYLMAYDVERDDWRSFRLDRMGQPHLTTFRFAAREAPDAAEFVQRGLTQAPYEHIARVRVHAPAAEVAARVPSTVAEISPETDMTCLLVAGGSDLDGMAFHLIRLGYGIEVLEPLELRESMRSLAGKLVTAASA